MKGYEFNNKIGSFTMTKAETGKNWCNHLWNDFGYHLAVTHTGLTHSRYVDKNGKQVILNEPESNCLYIRNDNSGEFWNVGIAPSCNTVENYSCTHSMEMTQISSEYKGISTDLSFAVSQRGTYEVWRLKLENKSSEAVNLSLFTGVQFTTDGFSQPPYYESRTTSQTVFAKEQGALLSLMSNPFTPNPNCNGFIFSSEPVFAYDGNYEKFIGTVGNIASPYTVREGKDCSNSLSTVRKRGGVLQNKITLGIGESKTVYYVIGLCEGRSAFEKDYTSMKEECGVLFGDTEERGVKRFGRLRTESPDERINNIMNFWAQKQVSFCMIGKKAVRDNAQIAMAMLNYDTELAKENIIECIKHQYIDGHAILNWQYDWDKHILYSDTAMWLMLAICELIKETGDKDFLESKFEYIDGDEESVYSHLKRAVEWYAKPENLGENGLTKIYYADWNDALNIPDDNAESVFLSMAVCLAYNEMALLCDFVGDSEYAERVRAYKNQLAEKVNVAAYNGKYYVRAIGKYGNVGDESCKDGGKIYVNPQTWAILADVVPDEYLENVLASIDSMENEAGIPLCLPPYSSYDKTVGRMSGMLAGVYENGGVYNHACGFKIMADCKIGRTQNAVKTFLKMIPDGENNPSSLTTTEPYVFTNCYLQHDAVKMIVGSSWQTGTSAWGLRDYYEGILGLLRNHKGLELSPCIPQEWERVYAERTFRGDTFEIEYINNNTGSMTVYVDGEKIEGNILPQFSDGKRHKVTVNM